LLALEDQNEPSSMVGSSATNESGCYGIAWIVVCCRWNHFGGGGWRNSSRNVWGCGSETSMMILFHMSFMLAKAPNDPMGLMSPLDGCNYCRSSICASISDEWLSIRRWQHKMLPVIWLYDGRSGDLTLKVCRGVVSVDGWRTFGFVLWWGSFHATEQSSIRMKVEVQVGSVNPRNIYWWVLLGSC
jgi:hypothetical protein